MIQHTTDFQEPAQAQNQPVKTVALVSLGCPKNLVDSEKMLGLLADSGLIPVSDHSQADAIVINTCGFLEASKQESLEQIRQAAMHKLHGVCQRLVVAGCLAQRHRAKILQWCPQVDALIGVFDRDRIIEAVTGSTLAQNDLTLDLPIYSSIASTPTVAKRQRDIDDHGYYEDDTARLRLTPRHYAYLRISEGCNQNCAFCTIPSIRGKMRSKPVDRVLTEVTELVNDGAFELNLIGQDTTSYGQDIGYAPGLPGLLRALDRAMADRGGGWLRLMYAYPSCFTEPMIQAIAQLPHVIKYIDMPLQHINDQVLNQMRRGTSRKLIEKLLGKLRTMVPGIAIRTTFITGFPGETEQQHQELLEFISEFRFDAMGVFRYSPEPGTVAGTLHAQGQSVADEVMDKRYAQLMEAQQAVAFAHNAHAVKQQVLDVLIDSVADHDLPTEAAPQARLYCGRTYQQAPLVDGLTWVRSTEELSPGEVVRCRITDFNDYDLIAQPLVQLQNNGLSLPVMH